MVLRILQISNASFFLKTLIVMISLTFYGCSGDTDAVTVDFSKTVAMERSETESASHSPLRVAVGAMISPKETFVYYRQLLDYIGRKIGREIELIQRKTYGEINELFEKGKIDVGFICSGPFAIGKDKYGFELLATPQVQGKHNYQSYLIVNKNNTYDSLDELRGLVFAFTDPDSNSGKLVPTYWLAQIGETPDTFFGKTIFTYGHDNSIMAVAKNLVDGAAVDSLIWEYYHHRDPIFTSKTRVIRKSEPYGIPPFVSSRFLSKKLKKRIQQLLFSMHKDQDGQSILKELMIDRIIPANEKWYDSIRLIQQRVALLEDKNHASAKP